MFSQSDSNLRISSVTSLKPKTPTILRRTRCVPYSRPSEETPTKLPFPPRRHDEPETDPLAESTMPVITHVTSLHANPPAGVKLPPGIKLGLVPGRSTGNEPAQSEKPRISVKSTAELSGTQSMAPVLAPKATETPQPVNVEVVLKPNGQKPHMILTPTSSPSTYSLVQNGKSPILVNNKAPGQPIVLPLSNFNPTPESPLLVTGPKKKVLLVTNITKRDFETPPSAKEDHANSDKPTDSIPTTRITSKLQLAAALQTRMPPQLAANTSPSSEPTLPTNLVEKSTPPRSQQSMSTIKDVIVRTRKRTRLLQRKMDFLKLKITTYEAFISHLVRKAIISKNSARDLQVLDTDVTRYYTRRNMSMDCDDNEPETAEMNDNGAASKDALSDPEGDTTNEMRTTNADHDYF